MTTGSTVRKRIIEMLRDRPTLEVMCATSSIHHIEAPEVGNMPFVALSILACWVSLVLPRGQL